MAKKFLTPIDLNQLELQNARLQNLATAPSSPVKGQMYYNTTSNKALVWDGTAWVPWEVGGVTGVKGNSESTYRTGNVNLTAANIGAAASSHDHGNITSGGDITATAPTIASGDQIIINDHSASKITNGPTFDGSTTTKALTPKGTWETFNNYSHPTYTANAAAAVKVGNDATGHVVIGAALAKGDVGLGNVDNTADANKTVNKANQLTTARDIDGISFNGSAGIHHLATVAMSSSTFTYDSTNNRCLITVNKTDFTPSIGAVLYIWFQSGATMPSGASDTTQVYLKIGSNYSAIKYDDTGTNKYLTAKQVYSKFTSSVYGFIFTSDSNCYVIGDIDTNTTYSGGTQAQLTAGTDTSNRVWQPKILHDYIASAIGAADAMRFKGTIGTGGDVTALPTTNVMVGDTYRVITAGTYAGQTCEIGDLIIATATTPTWTVAQTNIDGAITSISGTSPISVTGSGSSRTVSISDATTSASGAMSSSDKTKLNGIATGAEVNQNAFSNVAVSGQTTVAADSKTDTLTLAAGTNITLTTDATNDKVTIGTSAEVNQNAFSNVKVGSTTVAADSKTDTLELVAGSNITLTPDATNDKITIDASNPEYLVQETTVTIGTNATSATFTHKEPDKYINDGKMFLDYTAYMDGAEVVVDHTQTRSAVQESGITQYYNVTETFSVASSPSSAIAIKIHYRTWTR